jgi:hypothetical protein
MLNDPSLSESVVVEMPDPRQPPIGDPPLDPDREDDDDDEDEDECVTA